jgi:hypothetical protein
MKECSYGMSRCIARGRSTRSMPGMRDSLYILKNIDMDFKQFSEPAFTEGSSYRTTARTSHDGLLPVHKTALARP